MAFFRFLLIVMLIAPAAAIAQNTTREDNSKGNGSKIPDGKPSRQKILLIPFDPKLYMSEADPKIGRENKMTFPQLRATFRSGLDYKILSHLKTIGTAYSLLSDSVANKKDMQLVYESIGYDYDKPNPGGEVSKRQAPEKQQPKIQNGQLAVEMSDEFRFMNAKIVNPRLLPYLQGKHKADVFLFITELDIRKDPESYDIVTDTYMRDVIVHYTIFDRSGKRLNAGVVVSSFSSTVNDPKTIINTAFAEIGKALAERAAKAIAEAPAGPAIDPLKQK